MKLFCFASRSWDNIVRGVASHRWAVATTSDRDQMVRRTKSQRYVQPGDCGLLYCNPLHAFVMPFCFETKPDPYKIDRETWQEPWIFPFAIRPLCALGSQVSGADAGETWSIAKQRFAHMGTQKGGISAAMHITGATVFSPLEISAADWKEILGSFGVS